MYRSTWNKTRTLNKPISCIYIVMSCMNVDLYCLEFGLYCLEFVISKSLTNNLFCFIKLYWTWMSAPSYACDGLKLSLFSVMTQPMVPWPSSYCLDPLLFWSSPPVRDACKALWYVQLLDDTFWGSLSFYIILLICFLMVPSTLEPCSGSHNGLDYLLNYCIVFSFH